MGRISKMDDRNDGHKGGTSGGLIKREDVVQNATRVLLSISAVRNGWKRRGRLRELSTDVISTRLTVA